MNATEAVVDGKMEPVTSALPAKQGMLTGQWLYDTFVAKVTDGEVTRMAQIRELAKSGLMPVDVKGACDKLVEIAREKDIASGSRVEKPVLDNAGNPIVKKDGSVKTTAERGTLEQQAMNVRTIIQQSWGALRFAEDALKDEGYTDTTGYLAMRVIAKRALEKRGIDWKGDPLKTDADKQRAQLAREQKTQIAARTEALKNLPMNPGESDMEYFARLAQFSKQTVESAKLEAERAIVSKAVEAIAKKYGEHRLITIAEAIFSSQGITGWEATNSAEEEAEPTEQEVADAMAAVSEEQAAH